VKKIANSNNIKKEKFYTPEPTSIFSPSFSQNYVANKFFLKIGTNCSVGVYFSLSIESID
jgi:hypothetical protein